MTTSPDLLRFYDVIIRKHDLDTLASNEWLNDTIIEFHMEYLDRTIIPHDCRILLLRPGMVQLITHIQDGAHLSSALPPRLPDYHAIFIPVNDSRPQNAHSGSHWSLMVFLRATNTFYYYDSLRVSNINAARLTAGRLARLLRLERTATFIPVKTPQQNNGADCGAYVIAITDFLVQKLLAVPDPVVNTEKLMRVSKRDIATAKQVRRELRNLILRLSQQRTSTCHIS